jgi:hypothetical protein
MLRGVLAESAARWLLVAHTALGVAAVAAATHLVIWLRRYARGSFGKRGAVIRFAWLVLVLQLAAFACGNVMYPTYKVEVRSAYLENARAIAADRAARGETATTELVRSAAQAARWFDVKEHWVALGIFASAALLLALVLWDPTTGRAAAPILVGLAALVAATLWIAAIIGVLTASWRAV